MTRPLLVLLAHGTADPNGQATLEQIRRDVASALPTWSVQLAFADVIEPTAQQVLAGTSDAVVVPVFLTSGYHVQVDAPAAAASAERVRLTAALGPDPAVITALADRVTALPGPAPRLVVVAGAGSSRPQARAEVEAVGTGLGESLGIPVRVGFLSGPGPGIQQLLAAARGEWSAARNTAADASAVVLAPYLLAPGHFARVARRLAVEQGVRCTDPIGAHPQLIELIVSRAGEAQNR